MIWNTNLRSLGLRHDLEILIKCLKAIETRPAQEETCFQEINYDVLKRHLSKKGSGRIETEQPSHIGKSVYLLCRNDDRFRAYLSTNLY